MLRRSPNGPICPHCGQLNPAALQMSAHLKQTEELHGADDRPAVETACIHCHSPFNFYIERLPFFVTQDSNLPRCNCSIHAEPGTANG